MQQQCSARVTLHLTLLQSTVASSSSRLTSSTSIHRQYAGTRRHAQPPPIELRPNTRSEPHSAPRFWPRNRQSISVPRRSRGASSIMSTNVTCTGVGLWSRPRMRR